MTDFLDALASSDDAGVVRATLAVMAYPVEDAVAELSTRLLATMDHVSAPRPVDHPRLDLPTAQALRRQVRAGDAQAVASAGSYAHLLLSMAEATRVLGGAD